MPDAPGAAEEWTADTATPPQAADLVLRLRKELTEHGLDAGTDTIGWHLACHHATTLTDDEAEALRLRSELLDQVSDEELPRYAEALRRLGE
ncbi:hypothetical protein [Parafrankia sp. FMc2]|uniref:hypothetical protein n=1 Tax=Parafrankia sp. FMc2 TaxID=3233196 RepID=UPI0034D7B80F